MIPDGAVVAADVVLETRGLSVNFGGLKAVDQVSFEVDGGEVFGFLGPNGAGKSTRWWKVRFQSAWNPDC